ncbi:MlaD family protein [Arcobacter sp. LA11]|uniref:MlaD family protein n=1 Tax=Arcobacter sp. LA11 TaxID=1898176 RepID=UPI000933CDDA|nr:MlaD family protein [Arcobacter sp. LA11]
MENKARYTVVGLFVLVFTIAMVLFILWLARYDIEEINAKEYRLYSKTSIGGLNKNSIIEYKGLDIGIVEKIQINPKNLEEIEIILKITKPEVIKTDSFAIIQSQGVTGNKIIEIDGGTSDSKLLEVKKDSYAVIPLKKSFIDKITSSAGNISEQIETVLKRFENLLNEKNLNNIDAILTNTNNSTRDFDEMVLKVNKLIDTSLIKTLDNVNKMTTSMDNVIKNDISKTVTNVDKLSKNLNLLAKDIQVIVNNDVKLLIKDLKETANSSQDIDKVLDELEITLQKIDSTVEEFSQNGGDMIFKTRKVNYGPGELEDHE